MTKDKLDIHKEKYIHITYSQSYHFLRATLGIIILIVWGYISLTIEPSDNLKLGEHLFIIMGIICTPILAVALMLYEGGDK
jgi:hypothetical protein